MKFDPVPEAPPMPKSGRLSMTLMSREDVCPRSAYLDLAFDGGAPSHAMHRGSLFHLVAKAMMDTLIEQGEPSFFSLGADAMGEGLMARPEEERATLDEMRAETKRQVASLTAAFVDGALRDHPELVVPQDEVDRTREMAYHWGVGLDVDPETVIDTETRFVMQLGDVVVSGIIDVLLNLGDVIGLDDYKTSFDMLTKDEAERDFQLKFYAMLVAFGRPLMRAECPGCNGTGTYWHPQQGPCESCEGKGYVEQLGSPIGDRTGWFRGRLVYPRYLGDDGLMRTAPAVFSRTQLADFRADLETKAVRFLGRFESGDWPAVPGDHCGRCPAQAECPIPPSLRRHAGTINTVEQAEEAAEWVERTNADVKATVKELRVFGEHHGPVRAGSDYIYDWNDGQTVKTDREALEQAVQRTVEYGIDGDKPFDISNYQTTTVSTAFRRRKLKAEEK